jgi:PIN domain
MAIRRAAPKPHVVVVDTNALWHKEKKYPVSPEFDSAWDANTQLATLELVIPEVVRGELIFQQTSSAWKQLEKVSEGLSEISAITASEHRTRIKRERVQAQVEAKVDRWIRSRRAVVAPTPYSRIDWPQMCADALWRRPPFSSDPKNPEVEKGFRDALILATLVDVAAREQRDLNLVFVSNDFLLRTTAQRRLRTDARFSAYETIAGFGSYVKLTREQLDNVFIKEILDRAAAKFFTPNDTSSLYLRESIAEKISAQYGDYFVDPERSDKSPFKLPSDKSFWGPWIPLPSTRWWLAGHEFVSITEDRIYHWKSRLISARGFRRKSPLLGTVPSLPGSDMWNERILMLPFDVFWKAFVKDDARFYDVHLERIEVNDNEFRMPTEQERAYLGFTSPETAA